MAFLLFGRLSNGQAEMRSDCNPFASAALIAGFKSWRTFPANRNSPEPTSIHLEIPAVP